MPTKVINKNGTIKYKGVVKLGGKQRVCKNFDSFAEAKRWETDIRFKRNKKIFYRKRVTIQMLFENYLHYATDLAPSSVAKAKTNFRKYLDSFYNDADMITVSVEEHEACLGRMIRKGLAAATRNRVLALLSVMYNTAIRKRSFGGQITVNPCIGIDKLTERRKNIDYWNQEEINKFLATHKESYYYPMVIMLLNTGLRVGEIVALDRSQFDTSADVLVVDRIWCKTTKGIKFRPKGRKSRYLGLNKAVQEIVYPTLTRNGLVFTREDGGRLQAEWLVKSLFPRMCEQAEVKYIGAHGFRHTFSAHYLMNGGSIWDLQKILGHSTPVLTDSYYGHFTKDHMQKRANILSIRDNVVKADFGGGSLLGTL